MNVRITHLDGKLPNLALMRLSAWHKNQGDVVVFSNQPQKTLFDLDYDVVYGSAIFTKTSEKVKELRCWFPNSIVGGTGTDELITVEDIAGDFSELDYSIYPDFKQSIGFTQRGCRMKCKFCVVPQKEGGVKPASAIAQIYRGYPAPKELILLDNDFFGNTAWRDVVHEIVVNDFKVCLSQGINVRLIGDEQAEALAAMKVFDTKFKRRRIYTAWDNLGHEKIFFKGIDRLARAGIKPNTVMAYMLIGYAPGETLDSIQYRFDKMVERGIKPYPMVYNDRDKELKRFQRWAVRGIYNFVKFEDYR